MGFIYPTTRSFSYCVPHSHPGTSPISGLWHILEITLPITNFHFLCPAIPISDPPSPPHSPPNPFSNPVLSHHPPKITILFALLRKIQLSSLGSSLLFVFIGSVDYIAWLSYALWLIPAYKRVHTMHILWVWVILLRMIFSSSMHLLAKFILSLFLIAV